MTDRKSLLLRINPRLHRVLERWAAEDLRSLNSQIEFLLVEAAKKSGRWVAQDASEPRDEARGL
jgi:hypothetical protein